MKTFTPTTMALTTYIARKFTPRPVQIHLKLQLHLLLLIFKNPVASLCPNSCVFTDSVTIVIYNTPGKVSRAQPKRNFLGKFWFSTSLV